MAFELPNTFTSYVISSPSHFIGDFQTDTFRIDHLWPDLSDRNAVEGMMTNASTYHHRFIISVKSPNQSSGNVSNNELLRYYHGERMAMLASIWYGKSFQVLGTLIDQGMFFFPRSETSTPAYFKTVPTFNNDARKDLQIDLNWSRFAAPFGLLALSSKTDEEESFWNACRFYRNALNYFTVDPEVAFFLLISALECIGGIAKIPEAELFDSQTLTDFQNIESGISDGKKIVNRFRGRLYQIRRRVKWISEKYLNDSFFNGGESKQDFCNLKQEDLPKAILDAYDLRSKYAHEGAIFGLLVEPHLQLNNEKVVGDSSMLRANEVIGTLPKGSLTFLGLERLTRFIILAFCHNNIFKLDDKLQIKIAGS